MTDFVIVAVILEAVVIVALAAAFIAYRRAKANATACDFPGCLAARAELRRLADEHDAVPRQDVLAAVEIADPHTN